jgi:multidrug efflux pump
MNPVFAVDFMKPHVEGEHDNPKFDKVTKRALIYLAGATAVGYWINVGIGNFMVLIIVLYLLNHFFLLKVIDRFQKTYGRVSKTGTPSGWRKQYKGQLLCWLVRLYYLFSIVLTATIGKTPEFFPAGDPNFAYVYITMPIGTDQATTNEVTKKLEKRVAKVVEVIKMLYHPLYQTLQKV